MMGRLIPLPRSLLLFAFLLLFACQNHSLSVSRLHDEDRVTWLSTSSGPHMKLRCPRGIGSMVVSTVDTWPSTLTISLQLSALEGFELRADTRHFRLGATSAEQVFKEPNMKNPLSFVRAPFNKNDNDIIVQIDLALLNTDQNDILLSWVDYYR